MSSFMKEFGHLRVPLLTIRNATNNFGDDNFIAEGGYGKVYKGEFLHFRSKGQITGAVKRWNPSNDDGDPEFRREIMLLSDNTHENLISLLGFCNQDKERILVYEYAPNKSLDFHLRDSNFTWIQRLKICLGAARGFEYLHNPRGAQRVLHCDIKSANILLDENWNAKIADFGLSKYGPATQNRSYLITQAKGTPGYADPQFLETMIYTKESDVYSFGVVMFEVLCSRFCFDLSFNDRRRSLPILVKNLTKEAIRDTLVDVNLRQQIEEDSFDTFVTVALRCLEKEQKQRPSMDLIVKELERALKYQELRDAFTNYSNVASSSTPDEEKEKQNILAQMEQARRKIIEEEADDDIKRWARGQEWALGYLLSKLQDILGPESGWVPISPGDLRHPMQLLAVYNKSLLITNPLSIPGASMKKKYIYGKVHTLLRKAWVGLDQCG